MKDLHISRMKLAGIVLLTVLLTTAVFFWTGEIIGQEDRQVISFDTKSVDPKNIERFKQVWTQITDNYIDEVDNNKMLEGAISGMVESLGDPYSGYLTPKMMAAMMEEIEGVYYGIGVSLTMDKDGLLTVVEPFKDSPAAEAGVMVDDKIVEVDGQDVTQIKDDQAIVAMVRGPEGTQVKIKFYRQAEHRFVDMEITRKRIVVRNLTDAMLDAETGYIHIKSFEGEVSQFFTETMDVMLRAGAKGLVIDLRDNPGGMVREAAKIADKLLPKGIITYTIDRHGNRYEYDSDENQTRVPIVVLVNQRSASASEIVAGAVRDYQRGKLVGVKTFGKGIVQRLSPVTDDAGLNLTTGRYYLPSDVCIHNVGIEPDVQIEPLAEYANKPVSYIPRDKDVQLQKALEILKAEIEKTGTQQ
ncbi:MAG TPA: S41 family peptidase [Clostridiales bacterium]|nr:S41 family peptidase [Clostridiales bacterium]